MFAQGIGRAVYPVGSASVSIHGSRKQRSGPNASLNSNRQWVPEKSKAAASKAIGSEQSIVPKQQCFADHKKGDNK